MKTLALSCFIIGFSCAFGSDITETDTATVTTCSGEIGEVRTCPELKTTLGDTEGPNVIKFDDVRVKTSSGEIEGVLSEFQGVPVKTFLGIPYASPPVGNLRFLRPEPIQPWGDTLQAKTEPPACMQLKDGAFPDSIDAISEDCLYLNIFTPFYASNKSRLAVLFWIHGGAFTVGSNRLKSYDGSPLAEREDLIVVTVNYRLNLFGFLASNTSDAPGNAGLYDLVEALRWVNDNIEHFGGDKTRITVHGESAGSVAAGMLCVSPLTEGLFSRAILQSSSVCATVENNLAANLDLAQKLAKAVECATDDRTIHDNPTEVVQCLREKDATLLSETLKSLKSITKWSFKPQYGDTVLPNNGADDVRNGNFHNISILTGVCTDEGSFFLTKAYPDVFGVFGEKDAVVNKTFAVSMLQRLFRKLPETQKHVDHYLKDVADDDYDLIRRQVHTAWGDLLLFCPTAYFAEKFAEKNKDAYYYEFNNRPSNTRWAEWMGVVHTADVQFTFGRPLRVPADYTAAEVTLSAQMMKLWANFAKDGHPGKLCSDVFVEWPKYSKENPIILKIGTSNFGALAINPHQESCNLLREYYRY